MPDVIVIGGGVIGLTSAYELAGRGLSVTVLDQGSAGREASWAGAGILPPGHPGDPDHPLAALCARTHPLWPVLSEELRIQTGIDNGFRQCGGIGFSPDGDAAALDAEIAQWRVAGAVVEALAEKELRRREPAIGNRPGPAYYLRDTWQVRNPRHLKALLAAGAQRGVNFRSGQMVTRFEHSGNRVEAALTTTDRFHGGEFLVTAGAWSTQLLESVGGGRKIEPVRGQIVLLNSGASLVHHVLEVGPRYIVPRPDGRTLVGSTEEWVGFEKRNTPQGVAGLLNFAVRMVPALAEADMERMWSGLRPHPVDGLPLLGRVPGLRNLSVAAGHFRAGLHLSPITARLMAQLITGEPTDLPLTPFDPVG